MIAYHHSPGVLGDRTRASGDLAGWPHLLRGLVAAEHVDAGVGRIGQKAEDAGVGQAAPQQLAVPCTAIRTAREAQAKLLEPSYNAVGCALAFEQFEDRANRALHLAVGIEHDLVFVEDKADRQCKPQTASGCLIELAAVEARADDV